MCILRISRVLVKQYDKEVVVPINKNLVLFKRLVSSSRILWKELKLIIC